MSALLSVPRVWELLKGFKDWCRRKGWRASEEEDWIRVGHEYHDFVWAKNVSLSTFTKVTQSPKCTVPDGYLYHVVNASYVAWLFQQSPPDMLVQILIDNPALSARTAVYDLSPVYQGNPVCLKLNSTKSQVFKEFEHFLSENWRITVKASSEA